MWTKSYLQGQACLTVRLIFLSNKVEEKILHGTTTVGIKASDGVVLCADMQG